MRPGLDGRAGTGLAGSRSPAPLRTLASALRGRWDGCGSVEGHAFWLGIAHGTGTRPWRRGDTPWGMQPQNGISRCRIRPASD